MNNFNQNRIANLEDWKPIDFWKYSLRKYRVSKTIRKLIDKDDGYSFTNLAKKLGVTRQYLYNIMLMNISPNDEFANRLEKLLKGGEK